MNETRDKIERLTALASNTLRIDPALYEKYDVKRGLRDIYGKGVMAGLTEIADVVAYKTVDGQSVPCRGELYYRGINVEELVAGFRSENRFGFEETAYLLLFGRLPDKTELQDFCEVLRGFYDLPEHFADDVLLTIPSRDTMNTLAKGVLSLYSFDDSADDISPENVLEQALKLIARFPSLAVYGYQVYKNKQHHRDTQLNVPDKTKGIAENLLILLRGEGNYTDFEAKALDLSLVLHAEHGCGNNSSFTTHVVTSSGTDTYSSTAASLASLKGPRHGGANIRVSRMFADLRRNVADPTDSAAIEQYLVRLLHKEAFDRAGLIYGMGHAVYSLSDPRADLLRELVIGLAEQKGMHEECALYLEVERLAPQVIARERKIYKGVSTNVDFYSGLLYSMLGIPDEMFIPLFAVARIVGWSAHRIEEIVNQGKIIRPAYKCVAPIAGYIPMGQR